MWFISGLAKAASYMQLWVAPAALTVRTGSTGIHYGICEAVSSAVMPYACACGEILPLLGCLDPAPLTPRKLWGRAALITLFGR